MLAFFTVVHVLLCVFMIFVILLQPGKDAGMGAALGGGAATSAFGGRGAVTFLTKVTAICAALFFLTSLGLSFVGLKPSVVAGEEPAAAKKAAIPAPINAPPAAGTAAPVNPPAGGTPMPASGVGTQQPKPQTTTASPPPTPAAQTAPAAPSGAPPPASQSK